MARKDAPVLTIALQMREAVGYLAALASRSDLDAIARKLLGVHIDLGAEIDARIDEARAGPARRNPASKLSRH